MTECKVKRWRMANKELWVQRQKDARAKIVEVAGVKFTQARLWHYKQKHGLDREEVARIYNEQNGCCALCDKPVDSLARGTHLDHCHKTGRVRGFLCGGCNRALGWVEARYKRVKVYLALR